jgi:tetratricopeptide (TPR) repeat protein
MSKIRSFRLEATGLAIFGAAMLVRCTTSRPPPPSSAAGVERREVSKEPPKASNEPPKASNEDVQALGLRADTAYQEKDYRLCADLYARVAELEGKRGADDHFAAACCLASIGEREPAMAALTRAAELGYHDVDELGSQPRLDSLRGDPRFRSIADRVASARTGWLQTVHAEMYEMYRRDQNDRTRKSPSAEEWVEIGRRDAAHRERVKQLLASGALKLAPDYYHAAMIFQHGESPEDFRTAHELALKAVELDPFDRTAKWLAAASKDRELMNLGRPQRYGTQFKKVDGRWTLYSVDLSVTDAERAKWNVPPLAAAQRHVDVMNAKLH